MEYIEKENAKLDIATLSEAIISDPQSTLIKDKSHVQGFSKLRQLHTYLTHDTPSIQMIAILSMVAVFQDIIPGYRIRLPTAAEISDKRQSAEVRKLRVFEGHLLQSYQSFLKFLNETVEKAKKSKGGHYNKMSEVATSGMCELLKSCYHFNFRSNLLTVVVKATNSHAPKVRGKACEAVRHIFRGDLQGEISLEATRLMCRMVKDRDEKVHPDVLKVFQSLPLRIHLDEAEAVKIATMVMAKKRKKIKNKNSEDQNNLDKSINNDMLEGESGVDKIALARAQADTLHAVSVCYFRVLKSEKITALSSSKDGGILPTVLAGLAKIAHLINIDTVQDLLQHLKALLNRKGRDDELELGASLNCVLTAFQTLQGPGKELLIDEKDYVNHLYVQLQRLASSNNSMHVPTAIKCLESAFIRRRETSRIRSAAFVKLISTVALHLPPAGAVPMVAFARAMFHRYQGVQQLLENEADVIANGTFEMDVDDPERSNPFSTSLWELSIMKFSYNPDVKKHAEAAAAFKPLELPREGPMKLMGLLERRDEDFEHDMKRPKKHRFRKTSGNEKKHTERFVKNPNLREIIFDDE